MLDYRKRISVNMPRCLFCLRDSNQLTDEHVFPAVLGGDLTVRGTCVECVKNESSFSKEFEQPFATELIPLRHLLVIPDRYGRIPEVVAKVEVEGKELDAKLLSGGNVQLKPKVTPSIGKDGVKEILYEHLTDRQVEKNRRQARERGYELFESEGAAERQVEVSVSGTLKLIGAPEGLRSASKIAYTGFAFRAGSEFAIRNTSDDVRTYVRTGDGNPSAKLFLNEGFLAACAQGPHQHSIVIAGRNDKHRINAIVRLFGGLSYFVILTEQYEGADFYNTLVYDAQRAEVNKVLVVNAQAEFLQIDEVATSKSTIWDNTAASGNWLMRFIDNEIKSKLGARA